MSIFEKIKSTFSDKIHSRTTYQLVTERGNGIYTYSGDLFQSDIIRACVNPIAVAVGKAVPKHIVDSNGKIEINPKPYIRFLLSEPNPYMSMQMLLEKLVRQRELIGNSFALITRDEAGFPAGLYPINSVSADAIYDKSGNLYIKFWLENGKSYTFAYGDIIHLRADYCGNDIFGSDRSEVLRPLVSLYGTVDVSIKQAVKNGGAIKWLLQYNTSIREEDLRKNAETFAKNFLQTTAEGSGVAATDSKSTATQVHSDDYVPNAVIVEKIMGRLYAIFGDNEKIVQNKYSEDDWNAFYEGKVEEILVELDNEFTRKIFSRRERGLGNRIYFEASNLQYASMGTKLALSQMVDRGAMLPNEWRKTFNMGPVEGGDKPIRRLDTAPVTEVKGGEENNEDGN